MDLALYEQHGTLPDRDGVPLFYGLAGQGRPGLPLVLNDGIGCDGFAWRYLMPHLARRHPVVHWNYRAHGRSGMGPGLSRLTLPALAEDLLRLMDGLQLERAALVGHSMGTQVALEAYRLAPERVAGLVLLCGSYGRITHTFRGNDMLHRVLPGVSALVARHRSAARGVFGRIPASVAYRLGTLSGEIDARTFGRADFERYWDHIATMDPDRFLSLLDAAGSHTAEDLLPHVRTPTLVVAADGDTFTPPALAAEMAEQIPDAEHFVVRAASHAAPVEHPDIIQLRIDKFLRERVEGAADVRDAAGLG
ncbi:MAG: alpha/beta hydrolase [Polyangiales bacterium]|nr:alpha/beta hydrolase [Myxococcales bacterium]MCB9661587.1 alpha/beta hydrolase [Sandaracinaceae bacterium]